MTLRLAAGCTALAALTLLLPSTPTYDPWAWIIWGREVAHLDLVTNAGPSWKPLPVLFTTPFSLAGEAAPELWLVVARAGAIIALVAAARVAARLVDGPGAVLAGATAAAALALSPGWLRNAALGNSEGLLVALLLLAVDAHLRERRGQALAFGAGAALLRPEAWPFLGLYALWAFWRHPSLRVPAVVSLAVLPPLWFGPELWGSGDAFRASNRAQDPNPGSAAFSDSPAFTVVEGFADQAGLPVLLAALAAVAASHMGVGRRATGLLAAATVAWVALVAVMTEAGYSGNPRYVIPAVAGACVLAGVGVGALRGVHWAIAALALLASAPFAVDAARAAGRVTEALGFEAELDRDLDRAVRAAGGRETVLGCGDPYAGPYAVPSVAWRLHSHINGVGLDARAPAVVFRSRPTRGDPPAPARVPPAFREELRVGEWQVLAGCRPGARLR